MDSVEEFVENKKYDVYVKVKVTGVYRGRDALGRIKIDTGMKFLKVGFGSAMEPTIRYILPSDIAAVGEY